MCPPCGFFTATLPAGFWSPADHCEYAGTKYKNRLLLRYSGCRITAVYMHGVHMDRVRFPAARHATKKPPLGGFFYFRFLRSLFFLNFWLWFWLCGFRCLFGYAQGLRGFAGGFVLSHAGLLAPGLDTVGAG